MPTEAIVRAHRRLQIRQGTHRPAANQGSRERLLGDIESKSIFRSPDNGQTHPCHRHTISDVYAFAVEAFRNNLNHKIAFSRLHRSDLTHVLNNSREHFYELPLGV